MKVLWFTDSPSLAAGHLNLKVNITGWIESLQKVIMNFDEIELGVAFPFGNSDEKRFSIDNVQYYSYPYPKRKLGMSGWFERWKHTIEPQSTIDYYLKIVEEFQPDVIQIFGTEAPFGQIIPLVKQPVVIHIQGNLTVYEYKWFSGITETQIFRHSNLKSIIKAYGLWHLFYHFSNRAERERAIMKSCKYFTGRTNWDRRISRVLSPESTYFHCDELLRNEFYESDRWQIPSGEKVVLVSTVSSMPYKGLETVLRTLQLLNSNESNKFEWHIAGMKGTEEIVGVIEKATKTKFADQNIKFRGSLNPTELLATLLQANLYIHPSHIENSPNSVCEAMLIGMPVIATYSGGTPEMVANGVNGFLVQDGDPWSLAGAINELISDPGKMLEFGQKAHERAVIRHNRENVGQTMFQIYKAITLTENKKQQ